MRKFLQNFMVLTLVCTPLYYSVAQNSVGIGTTSPNPHAVLDLVSTDQGLLIPRSDTNTMISVIAPTLTAADDGLMMYATDINAFAYWDGDSLQWYLLNENMPGGGSSDNDWMILGDTMFAGYDYVVVGGFSDPDAKMSIESFKEKGLSIKNNSATLFSRGLYAQAENGSNINIAVEALALGNTSDTTAGVNGQALNVGSFGVGVRGKAMGYGNGARLYGVIADAEGLAGDTTYGIIGIAQGGDVNFSGYFSKGNVVVMDTLITSPAIGNPGDVLTNLGGGKAIWVAPAGGADTDWLVGAGKVYNASDNIGIGTANPNARLDVHPPVAYSGVLGQFQNDNNTNGNSIIQVLTNGSGNAINVNQTGFGVGLNMVLGNSSSSTNAVEVSSNGNNSKVMNLSHTGSTANSTDYTIYSSATGAGSNNIAGYFTASGAANNYAGIFDQGNVGIGTTTPSAKLDVVGNFQLEDGTQGLNKVLTSDASGNASWQLPGADADWVINGANMYSGVAGNVGIGTGVNVPHNALTVMKNVGLSTNTGAFIDIHNSSATIGALSGLRFKCNSTTTDSRFQGAIFHRSSFSGVYSLDFAVRDNSAATNVSTADIKMSVTSEGFVGIGSSAPDTTLHVVGNIKMVDGNQGVGRILTSDANGVASWTLPSATASGWSLTGNAGTSSTNFLGTTDMQNLSFKTNNVQQMQIDTIGNVGINQINSQSKLNVNLTGTGIVSRALNLENYYSGASAKYGIYSTVSSGGTGSKFGFYNYLVETNAAQVYGLRNNIDNDGTGITYAITNYLVNSMGTGGQFGLYNQMNASGTGQKTGVMNDLVIASGGNLMYGTYNLQSHGGNGSSYGTYSINNSTGTGTQIGTYHYMSNAGNGVKYGVYNNLIQAAGTNTLFGTYSSVTHNGTGTTYGFYSKSLGTSTQKYGVYTSGENKNYFSGDVGIGTLVPSAKLDVVGTVQIEDGTEGVGKVLTSDATGNASWQPNQVGFSVESNISQSMLIVGYQMVAWNIVGYDDGGSFDIANNYFVAPVAGVYHFDAGVYHVNAGGRPAVLIRVNGVNKWSTYDQVSTVGQYTGQISADLNLNPNDQVSIWVYSDGNTSSISGASGVTWFNGHLVYAK